MSPSILQFQPQPILTVIAVILAAIFIGLGFWQLERAEQKRLLTETRNTRLNLPPYQLTGERATSEQLEYRVLTAEGVFVPEKTVFIENRKHMGRNGFHVITPLRVATGNLHLLVNRGWVAAKGTEPVPSIETPTGTVNVTGMTSIPLPPALDLGNPEPSVLNPRWPYLTLERYALWSGLEVFPFLLLQAETDPHGFVRSWKPEMPKQGMHFGYAIQWFAFALIVSLIWLRLSLVRRIGNGKDSDEN